jgi:hypothetical protein
MEEAAPTEVVTTTKKVVPPVKMEHPQLAYEKKKTIFRAYQLIWFLLGVIEVLLAFRFILKMIGANPFSGFTMFIYNASAPFAGPFLGIIAASVSSTSILEWSTIIAAIVFFVLAWGLVQLLNLIRPVTPEEVSRTVDSA